MSCSVECELCLTVICYVLFLAASFVIVQCELYMSGGVICYLQYEQHRLCCCAMWAVSGGVIYYGAV